MPLDATSFPPEILPISIILIGLTLSTLIIYLGSMWLVYAKAGRSGWLIFIPIVNIIVLLRIAKQPDWHILLLFIPVVNIVIAVLLWIALGRAFGKSNLFGLGLIFFNWIFVMILAFGQSEYLLQSPRKRQIGDFEPINIRPT